MASSRLFGRFLVVVGYGGGFFSISVSYFSAYFNHDEVFHTCKEHLFKSSFITISYRTCTERDAHTHEKHAHPSLFQTCENCCWTVLFLFRSLSFSSCLTVYKVCPHRFLFHFFISFSCSFPFRYISPPKPPKTRLNSRQTRMCHVCECISLLHEKL